MEETEEEEGEEERGYFFLLQGESSSGFSMVSMDSMYSGGLTWPS